VDEQRGALASYRLSTGHVRHGKARYDTECACYRKDLDVGIITASLVCASASRAYIFAVSWS